VPPMPLYICDADSEGGLGFMITQVVVDPKDPAFKDPTKPIGPFYTQDQSERLTLEKGWVMNEDSGRGWRRNVASPRPIKIIRRRRRCTCHRSHGRHARWHRRGNR